jgi:hypothetical protein
MVRYNNGNDEPNSSPFNSRIEGFWVVDTFMLSESSHNQARHQLDIWLCKPNGC